MHLVNDDNWREWANCKGADTEIFFNTSCAASSKKAYALCYACLVRKNCLQDRIDTVTRWDEDPGIWGGTSSAERTWIRTGNG